jgi:hypothetical protein
MKKNILDFKKINIKKTLIILLFIALTGYVFYDISLKMVSNFRLQGYSIAIRDLATQAKNEECYPFTVFLGEEEISLINVSCLQQNAETEEMIVNDEIVPEE